MHGSGNFHTADDDPEGCGTSRLRSSQWRRPVTPLPACQPVPAEAPAPRHTYPGTSGPAPPSCLAPKPTRSDPPQNAPPPGLAGLLWFASRPDAGEPLRLWWNVQRVRLVSNVNTWNKHYEASALPSSTMIPVSLTIFTVVNRTSTEKIYVQIGSAILYSGWKTKKNVFKTDTCGLSRKEFLRIIIRIAYLLIQEQHF